MKNLSMKKRLLAAFLLVVLLVFGAAACTQQTQTLTDLLLEVNSLPRIAAEGEIYISIHDRGMELDFVEDGLPAELLQDATIKYQVSCDNTAKLAEVHLTAEFSCYAEPLECTFFIIPEYVYLNSQNLLKIFETMAEPDDYAEAQAELAGYDWLALPLESNLGISYYGEFSDDDLQIIKDEVEKFRATIGQAYADFSVKSMLAKGSSFQLELDNAGLADLINDFIDYTLDNYDVISQAIVDYINSSSLFEEYEREDMAEAILKTVEDVKNITSSQRIHVKTVVQETLTTECPMDFNIKYDFAKTSAGTYTLKEELRILFDEEYFGEPSDVLISLENTSKAAEDLQITLPSGNIFYPYEM